MKRQKEKCQIAGKQIISAHELIENGLAADTVSMYYLGNCHERPRENGGPATLPTCRNNCPFYKMAK